MGHQTSPQGGTRFRMLRAQFWTLARSKYISEGTQKWTLLGSKVVPPGGPVFGPFILSDVLKLCKLLCAQNVKLEATLTQTASVAGILNCTIIRLHVMTCGLELYFIRLVFFWGFGACYLSCTVTANGLCIDPIQFSFVSHCHYGQCCHCINSVNLHNAIVFPA